MSELGTKYGEICDRCRQANPGLAWDADLKRILCAECLRAWKMLKKMTNNWGRGSDE